MNITLTSQHHKLNQCHVWREILMYLHDVQLNHNQMKLFHLQPVYCGADIRQYACACFFSLHRLGFRVILECNYFDESEFL